MINKHKPERDRSSEQTAEAKAKKADYDRQYREKNRDRINERVRKWKTDNPEQAKEQSNRYYRNKYGPRKLRDWRQIVQWVKDQLETVYNPMGIKPTLRTMFYRGYSLGVIHNTVYDYNRLSGVTTQAREYSQGIGWNSKRSGKLYKYFVDLPINCFADNTRQPLRPSYEISDYQSPEAYIADRIDDLKNITNHYRNTVSRWLNQEHYYEVWIEKRALSGTFQSVLGDREVRIVPFGRYHSVSYLYDCAKNLIKYQRLGMKVHILYFGDFDPSGEDIERVISKKLDAYGAVLQVSDSQKEDPSYIDFRRIAVTKEQVEEFNLPTELDAETEAKIEGDPRAGGFNAKHGRLYQVELDSLPALAPAEFKRMVVDEIDANFDQSNYEKLLTEHTDNELNELVNQRVKFR